MRMEKYTLGKLAHIEKVHGRPLDSYSPGNIPYVTGAQSNNGVVGYVSAEEDVISDGNCIAVDPIKGFCMYQPKKFVGRGGSGASINLLYIEGLDELSAMYIIASIEKYSMKVAAYTNLFNSTRLSSAEILLPTLEETMENSPYSDEGYVPDFTYMRERIAELERERIAELERYLIATGLNDYELTDEDIETLSLIGKGNNEKSNSENADQDGVGIILIEFNLSKIAKIDYGNKFDRNKMTEKMPSVNFVSRTAKNNGISGVVDKKDDIEPYPAGTITLALGGSIGSTFVQQAPFYTGQNMGIISFENGISNETKIYIAASIEKICKARFVAFSDEINKHLKNDLFVPLPVKTNNSAPIIDPDCTYHPDGYIPDWDFMERYIRAVEKLVIADVVKYKDDVIAHTVAIVNKK